MKLFLVHLWREWREHRRSLYLLAGCLTLAVFMLSQQLSENAQRDPTTVRWTALIVIATVTISVGSDLFASEKQRATDAFLRRLPGGLSSAFCAKLVFFCLLITGATIFGLGLGTAAFLSNTGSLPEGALNIVNPWELTIYAAGLLWVFAVSTWVKSAALTLPSAALFLAGIAWPGWLLLFKGGIYSVTGLVLAIFLALAICGALVSSWMSFVGAGRRGHSHRRATIQGLGLACLFFAPSWAWAGNRYLVLQETQLTVKWVLLGEDGRQAFVTLMREPTHGSSEFKKSRLGHAVIVDMVTAQAKWVGGRNSSMWGTPASPPGVSVQAEERGYPVFELYSVPPTLSNLTSAPDPTLFDGLTGEPLEGEPYERIEVFERAWTWPEEFNTGATRFNVQYAGAGYVASWLGEQGSIVKLYWDPATNRVRDLARFSDQAGPTTVFISPSRWLIRINHAHWVWFDPGSNEAEEATDVEPGDSVSHSFDDGSLLLLRRGKPLRLDPESGELAELVLRSSTGGKPRSRVAGLIFQTLFARGRAPISSQERTAMMCLTTPDAPGTPTQGVAVLDPLTNTIQLARLGLSSPLGQGKGFALVLEGRRHLLQLDLETLETRLVLDLDEAGSVPHE